jgi:hypothetical protein
VWRYYEFVGGPFNLKPQDQYNSPPNSDSTIVAITPGGFVPIPKIEQADKPKSPVTH